MEAGPDKTKSKTGEWAIEYLKLVGQFLCLGSQDGLAVVEIVGLGFLELSVRGRFSSVFLLMQIENHVAAIL